MNHVLSPFLIDTGASIRDALAAIDKAGTTVSTLFVVDAERKLLGTLTDGDIRRGLIRGISIESPVDNIMHTSFKSITVSDLLNYTGNLQELRKKDIRFVPVLDGKKIADVLDLDEYADVLPVDAFMLAGGRGERLLPATRSIPKPMIEVGNKPIIAHNVDRLRKYGIKNIYISVNYLAEKIEEYFGDGSDRDINIYYVKEPSPLGTIGSIGMGRERFKEEILILNSDLLTNIDYSDFYRSFRRSQADMAVVVKPFYQDIPYAVIATDNDNMVTGLQEKPRYTYYTNAGIYLLKKSMLKYINGSDSMDATELMEKLIAAGHKVYSYPILNYWLDIGKPEDLKKAREDIKHLQL